MRQIPVDYVVDGYLLLAKAHIISRKPAKYRVQTEQVLKLKGIKVEVPAGFQFLGTIEMMRWIEQHYGLMEFADEEETMFLGWLSKADPVHFWIDFLTPRGVLDAGNDEDKPFLISEVQLIRFDTDYANSLKLLWQHKQRLKLRKLSDN